MSIVSQKVEARNEIGGTGFVWGANKGIVRDSTGWVLAPIGAIPEAFTTDVNDVQGQFPIVYNHERLPWNGVALHGQPIYWDNAAVGGVWTAAVTPVYLGMAVVSEEGAYIQLDIQLPKTGTAFNFVDPTIVPANVFTTTGTLSIGLLFPANVIITFRQNFLPNANGLYQLQILNNGVPLFPGWVESTGAHLPAYEHSIERQFVFSLPAGVNNLDFQVFSDVGLVTQDQGSIFALFIYQ